MSQPYFGPDAGADHADALLDWVGVDADRRINRISALDDDSERALDGLVLLGPGEAVDRGSAVSFNIAGVHPHDVMQVLDSRGVAIRGGHHCARPLHKRLGHQSSTRASSYLSTTPAEIDALADALVFTRNYFAPRFGG